MIPWIGVSFGMSSSTVVWINWMKQYVCTMKFAVLVSDRPQGGWIHPQRGIRHGCPLAPLLFILAADTLAICTEQLYIRGYLARFQTPGRPGGIPLLQCVNDTTFFLRGSMVDIFSDFSGLQLNWGKSSIVIIGLSSEELDRVSAVLATPLSRFPSVTSGFLWQRKDSALATGSR